MKLHTIAKDLYFFFFFYQSTRVRYTETLIAKKPFEVPTLPRVSVCRLVEITSRP